MSFMSRLQVLGSYLKEHLLKTSFKFQSYISNQEYQRANILVRLYLWIHISKSHMWNTSLGHASSLLVLMLASGGYL